MSHLRIQGLSRHFARVHALDGFSLEAAEGEFIVVVGPSGCGKSTLLRLVAGLEVPTGGSIELAGRDVTRLAPQQRDVAMVFQDYALYPHLTVRGNLEFPLRARKTPKAQRDQKVTDVAARLGLTPLLDALPRTLSGGQRQRVAVGRAWVREPKLFLYDEPLSNLDAALRAELRRELAALKDTLGVTSLYVTHDQVEALTLADRVVVLKDGQTLQIGTPREIYDHPAHAFVAGFIGQPKLHFVRTPAEALWGTALDPGGREKGAVDLGARPEHWRPGPGEGWTVQAKLLTTEFTGHHQVCTLQTDDGATFHATLDSGEQPPERGPWHTPWDQVHVFDPETGKRL